jgi:DnaJ like chaperone protein
MGLGKWIIGGLGWAMFGPIGGILGYFFTSRFEKFAEAAAAYQESQYRNQEQRNSFLISLLVLSAAIIKADGKVSSTEMSSLRAFFSRNFGPAAAEEAEKIVNEMLDKNIDVRQVCEQISANMDHAQRMQLFHYLVSLGASDGLVQKEIDLLERIAEYLGLTYAERDSIIAQFRPNNDSNYKILEIEPSATNEQVKKAYRKMAVKYHPDKVATLGEDIQKAAEEKFKAVQQAYDAICRERGI